MVLSVEQSTENYIVRAGELALAFTRQNHNWSHAICVGTGAEWKPVLQSVEWTPPDDRAPSPVFQDVWCERISATIVEFQALGQCGHVTYSGAVRFDAARAAMAFDYCLSVPRGRELPLAMASYLPSADVYLRRLDDGALQLSISSGEAGRPLMIVSAFDPGQRTGVISETPRGTVQLVNAGPAVTLAGASGNRLQSRLRYAISRA